jgi:hypothetical protein
MPPAAASTLIETVRCPWCGQSGPGIGLERGHQLAGQPFVDRGVIVQEQQVKGEFF